jgi:hypothetical protein
LLLSEVELITEEEDVTRHDIPAADEGPAVGEEALAAAAANGPTAAELPTVNDETSAAGEEGLTQAMDGEIATGESFAFCNGDSATAVEVPAAAADDDPTAADGKGIAVNAWSADAAAADASLGDNELWIAGSTDFQVIPDTATESADLAVSDVDDPLTSGETGDEDTEDPVEDILVIFKLRGSLKRERNEFLVLQNRKNVCLTSK